MIFRDPEGVGSSKCRNFSIFGIGKNILGAGERRAKEPYIPNAILPTVLGDLAAMNGQNYLFRYPSHLFRQFAERIAVFVHYAFGDLDLSCKFRIVGS